MIKRSNELNLRGNENNDRVSFKFFSQTRVQGMITLKFNNY